MALLAPMPRASVRTATAVKPGDLRSMRKAKQRSCQHVSTKDSQPAERTSSLVISRLPRSRRTARSAALRLMPRVILSWAAISRNPRSSSSSSPSMCLFRNNDRRPLAMLRNSASVVRGIDVTSFAASQVEAISTRDAGRPWDRPSSRGAPGCSWPALRRQRAPREPPPV